MTGVMFFEMTGVVLFKMAIAFFNGLKIMLDFGEEFPFIRK
jgi:hypothetical protein